MLQSGIVGKSNEIERKGNDVRCATTTDTRGTVQNYLILIFR